AKLQRTRKAGARVLDSSNFFCEGSSLALALATDARPARRQCGANGLLGLGKALASLPLATHRTKDPMHQ
ncbi:MAG: hypothetical protein OXF68_16735, partial [Gammaproteobacteria bacterium]|nr:hypothetical protein [Gammaproteobacteria bacterium]